MYSSQERRREEVFKCSKVETSTRQQGDGYLNVNGVFENQFLDDLKISSLK